MGIDKGGLGLTLLLYTVYLYEISKCLCEISKRLHMAVIAGLKLIMFACLRMC